MRIGHIDLSRHIAAAEEQLVVLIEALTMRGVEQHVLVRNPFLAKRLSVCPGVSVGPIVKSSVTACILMPTVDLVHSHEPKAVSAGMLLNLTRSVPYILTHRQFITPGNSPIHRLKYRRCDGIVCPSEHISSVMLDYVSDKPVDTIGDACNADNAIDPENGRISAKGMAAEYLRVYRRTLDSRCMPARQL
ncbi:MAG: glycosyltransferase [Proteobacteria bacterium]|nr:glycosyltransferase [Pseudomonadota bacterium]